MLLVQGSCFFSNSWWFFNPSFFFHPIAFYKWRTVAATFRLTARRAFGDVCVVEDTKSARATVTSLVSVIYWVFHAAKSGLHMVISMMYLGTMASVIDEVYFPICWFAVSYVHGEPKLEPSSWLYNPSLVLYVTFTWRRRSSSRPALRTSKSFTKGVSVMNSERFIRASSLALLTPRNISVCRLVSYTPAAWSRADTG